MMAAAIATMATVEAATTTQPFLASLLAAKLGSERSGPRPGQLGDVAGSEELFRHRVGTDLAQSGYADERT